MFVGKWYNLNSRGIAKNYIYLADCIRGTFIHTEEEEEEEPSLQKLIFPLTPRNGLLRSFVYGDPANKQTNPLLGPLRHPVLHSRIIKAIEDAPASLYPIPCRLCPPWKGISAKTTTILVPEYYYYYCFPPPPLILLCSAVIPLWYSFWHRTQELGCHKTHDLVGRQFLLLLLWAEGCFPFCK